MKFVDPPAEGQGRTGRPVKYMTPDVLEALAARPGQWALLIEGGSLAAKSSVIQWCQRNGGHEVTTRSRQPQGGGLITFDIYVRRIKEDQ